MKKEQTENQEKSRYSQKSKREWKVIHCTIAVLVGLIIIVTFLHTDTYLRAGNRNVNVKRLYSNTATLLKLIKIKSLDTEDDILVLRRELLRQAREIEMLKEQLAPKKLVLPPKKHSI